MAAMGYAILRMEPRTIQGTAAMLRHALREAPVPNAEPGAEPPQVLAGHGTAQAGMAVLRGMVEDCKAAKRWQKSIKPVVDVLVTFSRDDGTRLDKRQQDSYFRDALDFLNARYGAENVLCAAIHRDETTSHLQVLIAARHEGGRLSSSKLMGNRTALSALQDDFHEAVAKPFGLLRGEKRTNAKHVPVRALYAAMNAGAEPPDFRPVPPELTMGERLRLNGYQKKSGKSSGSKRLTTTTHSRSFCLTRQAADGRKLHPSLIAKQATRYRAAVQQAENAAQAATRAEKRAAEAGKRAEAREGQAQALDKLLDAKKAELERLDRTIEQRRGHGRDGPSFGPR